MPDRLIGKVVTGMIDFEKIKSNFIVYLNERYGKNYNKTGVSDDEICIFDYKNDFKNFLSTQFGDDFENSSDDISEILSLQYLDGKLVLNEHDNLLVDIINNALCEEAAIDKYDSDKDEIIDEAELLIFLNSITKENNISIDTIFEVMEDINGAYQAKIMLEELYKDEDIIKVVDLNGDGILSEKEKADFESTIQEMYSSGDDITKHDLENVLKDIKNGQFFTENEKQNNLIEKLQTKKTNTQTISSPGGGTGGVYNAGGNVNNNIENNEVSLKEKIAQKEEEIVKINLTAQNNIRLKEEEKRKALFEAGINTEEYNDYVDKVSDIDKNIIIAQNSLNILEANIAEYSSNIVSNNSTIEKLLKAIENNNSASKSDMGIDEKSQLDLMNANLSDRIAQLRNNNEELENLKEKAQADVQKTKDNIQEFQLQRSEILNEILPNLGNLSDELKQRILLCEEDIVKINTEKQDNISKIQQEIQELKIQLKNTQSDEDQKLIKENTYNTTGGKIVEFAMKFLGYNEADGSADVFLHKWFGSSKKIGWCAAFVEYVINNSDIDKTKLKNWWNDVTDFNAYWQVNVENYAKKANAMVSLDEARAGDIILYTYGGAQSGHEGLVVSYENGIMKTIEGNSASNSVTIHQYTIEEINGRFVTKDIKTGARNTLSNIQICQPY